MNLHNSDFDISDEDEELDVLEIQQQQEIENLYKSGQIPDFRNSFGNGKANSKQQQEQITMKLPADQNYFEYLVKIIQKTVKSENALIRQVLYTAFSAYIEDDPQNLLIIESTSEGKTYTITQSLQYFPDRDVMYIGQMSPKVLVRQKGIDVDKESGEPIEPKIRELKTQIMKLAKEKKTLSKFDQDKKAEIDEEIGNIDEQIITIYENSKTLINLTGKILVFLEPPNHELWTLLKPILSHDKKDIEFPFVDSDRTSNAKTKDVTVRGWPACIFCSARDESQWKIWPEIKSRMPITSPITDPQKYKEANTLTSKRKGLPKSIQQKIIISDEDKEIAKYCVLTIKGSINRLKSQNNGEISVWIPYHDLLDKEMPSNKGPDMRFTNRVFALLDIVPIIKHNLRKKLVWEDESSIIADLEDLKEVLSISHNLEGLPRSKAKFFNDVFLDLFNQKIEADSKTDKNGKVVTEEMRAVTTRELCDHFKNKMNKPINSDNMKHTYLNPLINEGIIDYTKSEINGKENIYFPIVTETLSITSIMEQFNKVSQQKTSIYEKITRNITEPWLKSQIEWLIRCRFGKENKQEIVSCVDTDLKILVNGNISESQEVNQEQNEPLEMEYNSTTMTIQPVADFIESYIPKSLFPIDNKISLDTPSFDKRSPNMSILAGIDIIDKNENKSSEEPETIEDTTKKQEGDYWENRKRWDFPEWNPTNTDSDNEAPEPEAEDAV